MLLEEDNEAVFDLTSVEVRGADDGCECLAAMAGEDGVDALRNVRQLKAI